MRIFTDGASSPNGRGGWAWVLEDDHSVNASGFAHPTTNQRMEVTAAFEAVLAWSLEPITIVSDSAYVVNCFNQKWWRGWERNGWRNSQKKDVANQDLWKPFVAAVKAHPGVTFEWIKGHSGHPANEYADKLAVEAKTLGVV